MRQGNATLTLLLFVFGCRTPPDPRPNIVILLADDLGWADLSLHGSQEVTTPRIDSLAADGVRFTNGYSVASICAPARAGLLTGLYPQRVGFEDNPPREADPSVSLPLGVPLLPERLRAAGYRTYGYGKWHLGTDEAYHPTRRGFDVWCGYLGGQRTHVPNDRADREGRLECDPPIGENFDWLSTHLAARAAADISTAPRPFFLYVAFPAVHMPLQADPEDRAAIAPGIVDEQRREVLAMVRGLDRAVGIVLDGLEQEGLDDNTLVFFASDNGAGPKNHGSNAPLRGMKGTPYEGGIRTPFLVRWPGRAVRGATLPFPVSFLDLTATVHAAAKLEPVPLDGMNLLPWLSEPTMEAPSRALYWRLGPSWAVRDGPFKLLSYDRAAPELYDLDSDPSELRDLSSTHPDVLARLRMQFDRWSEDVASN